MSEQQYQVIVSDRAQRMLVTHMQFLAQINKKAASEKKKEIMNALRSLSQMPQRFPFFDQLYIPSNKYHKMYIKNWYIILYQIQDDTVFVDYILDARKEYHFLLK